jgi:hypothetical protein
MVDAKRRELEKSFKSHFSTYTKRTNSTRNTNKSEKLILFYAIECGLKVMLLKKINRNSTKAFLEHNIYKDKLKGTGGHDLKFLLREINYSNVKFPKLVCNSGDDVEVKDYNQVWRYGIECNSSTEAEIERELIKIAEWLNLKI